MVHEASHWTQPLSIVFKQSSSNTFCTSHSLLIHSHNGIPACTDHQSLLPRQRLTRRANAVCDSFTTEEEESGWVSRQAWEMFACVCPLGTHHSADLPATLLCHMISRNGSGADAEC